MWEKEVEEKVNEERLWEVLSNDARELGLGCTGPFAAGLRAFPRVTG